MARPRQIDEELVRQATDAVSNPKDTTEIRCAQAVLLPALMGATLEQTAALLGVSRASVPRLQERFRQSMQTGKSPPRCWGGRRRSLMTFDEEKEFLEPWAQQAKTGGILVVSVIRAALGTAFRPTSKGISCVQTSGAPWLEKSGARYSSPQE